MMMMMLMMILTLIIKMPWMILTLLIPLVLIKLIQGMILWAALEVIQVCQGEGVCMPLHPMANSFHFHIFVICSFIITQVSFVFPLKHTYIITPNLQVQEMEYLIHSFIHAYKKHAIIHACKKHAILSTL